MSNVHAKYFQITDTGMLKLLSIYKSTGTKNSELPEAIVLPDEVDGNTVTTLESSMFKNNKRVVSIVLPDSVSVIPSYFCQEATNLVAITNTDNITEIQHTAFSKTALQDVIFRNVTKCGAKAFHCCGELKSLSVDALTALPDSFVYGCVELKRLYAPHCNKIGVLSLLLTEKLTDFQHSKLSSIGLYAMQQSAYRLTDSDRDGCIINGHPDISLWKNTDFIDKWRAVCRTTLGDSGTVVNPMLYSYSQDDVPWSEGGSSESLDIAWFNWGKYNPETKKYDKHLPDFDYYSYFNEEYAGELAKQKLYHQVEIDTNMGCTLHTVLGAYLGLYKPFGEGVVQNPKLIQDHIVKITGGRDKNGVPQLVNDWVASDPVYGDTSKCTHKWTVDYKDSLSRFKYLNHQTKGPTIIFNTTYLSIFVANRIGLKCEVVGYNHSNYEYTPYIGKSDNHIFNYLSDSTQWESYLTYIVQSIKDGNYVFLAGPSGGGNSQGHVTLIYGVDSEGYVYLNNTGNFKYREDDFDSQVCRIPFENIFSFCSCYEQSNNSFKESPNVSTNPLIVLSRSSIECCLSTSFTQNCELMLQNKDGTVEHYSTEPHPLIDSTNIDWNVLQEFVDTTNIEDTYYVSESFIKINNVIDDIVKGE